MSASETQFEHAKKWRWVDRLIGGTAAFLAAVAGVGALSQVSAELSDNHHEAIRLWRIVFGDEFPTFG